MFYIWKLVDYLKLHEQQYKWQRMWWPHHISGQFSLSHIGTRQMSYTNNSIQCVFIHIIIIHIIYTHCVFIHIVYCPMQYSV